MLSTPLAPFVMNLLVAAGLFGGRVEFAASLAKLLANPSEIDPVLKAYVIPALLIGRRAETMTGAYMQAVDRGITVLITMPIFLSVSEANGNRLEELVNNTVIAIVGECPDQTLGVFHFEQGRLLTMSKGIAIYQLDFSIPDQMRKGTGE